MTHNHLIRRSQFLQLKKITAISKWCCCGFRSSGMQCCLTRHLVPDVAKDFNAFISKGWRFQKESFDCFTTADGTMQTFEMFGPTQPMAECHIPEDLNPQLERNVICHFLTHNPLTAKNLLQFLQKWLPPPLTEHLANGRRIYFCWSTMIYQWCDMILHDRNSFYIYLQL